MTMVLNREGVPAFRRPLEEQAVQVLMTGNLQGTFYAGREQLASEAVEVLEALASRDPQLLARMAVYAREAGCLRLLPTLGVAVLSKHTEGDLFDRVFDRVVTTPREVRDYLDVVGRVRAGLGRRGKRALSRFLRGLSEHHLLKYARVDLRDALRLARPRPQSPREEVLFRLIGGGLTSGSDEEVRRHLPQVAAWRELRECRDSARRAALVEEGALPWEAVTAIRRPSKPVWRALSRNMPLMALLRNLAALLRHGAISGPEEAREVAARLTDPGAIRSARILPFRFQMARKALDLRNPGEASHLRLWTDGPPSGLQGAAMDAAQAGARLVLDQALGQALEVSMEDLLPLEGPVCLAPDISGSMSCPLSAQGTTRYVDIAALFAAALARRQGSDVVMLPFNHKVQPFRLWAGETTSVLAERLAGLCDGGTRLAAPLERLLDDGMRVRHFVGITDCEEWTDQERGGFLAFWRRYRAEVAPEARATLLTLAPYRDAVTPVEEPGVTFYYGWSEAVLRYMNLRASGGMQLDAVRAWPFE